MGYRNGTWLETYPQQVLNSAECAEMEASQVPQASHQSCSKDVATLKEPCINRNGALLDYEALLWETPD